MKTISMKGDFWANFVAGNRLIEDIKSFGNTVLTDITAIVTVSTTTAENTTGSVNTTFDSENTASKRPDLDLSKGAEIGLQNVIHKEVDSYANIAEWGSPTPT